MTRICKYCKSTLDIHMVGGSGFRKNLPVKICPVCDAPGRAPKPRSAT